MVATVILVLSSSPEDVNNPNNPQVVLSQVASDDVKELEDFGNKIAEYSTELCK